MFKKIALSALLSINLLSYANTTECSYVKVTEYTNSLGKLAKELKIKTDKVKALEEKKKYVECIKIVDEIIANLNEFIAKFFPDATPKKNDIFFEKLSLWLAKRGEFNTDIGCYKEAVEDCEKALCLDEHNAYAYYVEGCAYLEMKHYELGKVYIKTAAKKGFRKAKIAVAAYHDVFKNVKVVED